MQKFLGLTATEIASLVRTGVASPTQVVEAHLGQMAKVEGEVGAYVIARDRSAREEARWVSQRSDLQDLPLAGVPVAIKDNVDVAGEPTRHGSRATSDGPAEKDDGLVQRLRDAGAIVVGKTRVPELCLWGASDDATGIARNPWNLDRVPGGSSGGSAAAVASGTAPIALGSDGLGSVRIPSACCGLFGMKPGSGVVPMDFYGRDEHWFGMSQFGPLATTVDDGALMLSVLADDDSYRDVAVPPARLRVAVSLKAPQPGMPVKAAWRGAAIKSAKAMREAGHEVAEADPPYSPAETIAIVSRWSAGALDDIDTMGLEWGRLQARTRRHAQVSRAITSKQPVDPADVENWQGRMGAFFERFDVLLTPALIASPIKARRWSRLPYAANIAANGSFAPMSSPWNLADFPAASVPAGVGPDGCPLSVQVVCPRGKERRVLSVARQLEIMRPWSRHAPLAGI